jgi:hypothetical protein
MELPRKYKLLYDYRLYGNSFLAIKIKSPINSKILKSEFRNLQFSSKSRICMYPTNLNRTKPRKARRVSNVGTNRKSRHVKNGNTIY